MGLLGALWLPTFAAPSAGQAPIRLFDLTTAHAIVDEKPFEASRVFASDDDVIFLWYTAEGCTVGTTIRSTWLYLETNPPSRLTEGSVLVDREGAWGQFNFRRAPGRRWPLGPYRIELRIGDTLMADTEFVVVSVRPTVLHEAHAETVRVWQKEIEQHEVHASPMALERFGGRFGLENPVTFLTEAVGQRPANQLFVINDQDGRRAHAPGIRSGHL